jgi:hypothetical protein
MSSLLRSRPRELSRSLDLRRYDAVLGEMTA